MSGKNRKTGKVDSTRAVAALLGIEPPSAAGGTIPRPWLAELIRVAFGEVVDLQTATKKELIRTAIERAGGTWDPSYISATGATITGEAVQYLFELLQEKLRHDDGASAAQSSALILEDTHMSSEDQMGVTVDDVDERARLDLESLADQMEALSQPGEIPLEVEPERVTPFDAQDVRFDDNSWLVRLLDIQPWLYLDQPLSLEDGTRPERVAELLFSGLGADDPWECYDVSAGGVVMLNDLGIQRLDERISRAVENRDSYHELREDGRTRADASSEWRALWEDGALLEREPVSITASVDTWRIKDISDNAKAGLLDLNPSYQRDVVWSNSESQLLIESVLRGIPLPSVILSEGASEDGRDLWPIVDGKQRITALLRFLGHHPEGRKIAEGMDGGLTLYDHDFAAFARKNRLSAREINDNFMPFRLPKYQQASDPLHELSGKYYSEIRDKTVPIGGRVTRVYSLFESSGSPYRIPVIIYQRTSIRDIHRVFSLYNKQGRKLNPEEIRNAAFHHLDLTRLLLVLSGDRPDPDALTPFLTPGARTRLAEASRQLEALGFGTARFKRTKVLSWALSILLQKPNTLSDGTYTTPSTAKHIDAMLADVKDRGRSHPLNGHSALNDLAKLVQDALLLHRQVDGAWHPRFRRKAGQDLMASKWEELAVVASLLATALIIVAGAQDKLRGRVAEIRALTETLPGPAKSQNRTQWSHIARSVVTILDHLGIEDGSITPELNARLGYSCLPTLRAIAGTTGR